jgi:hypothetical protein
MERLGWVEFTDGIKRPVFEMHGRQHVEVEGRPVFGGSWTATIGNRRCRSATARRTSRRSWNRQANDTTAQRGISARNIEAA